MNNNNNNEKRERNFFYIIDSSSEEEEEYSDNSDDNIIQSITRSRKRKWDVLDIYSQGHYIYNHIPIEEGEEGVGNHQKQPPFKKRKEEEECKPKRQYKANRKLRQLNRDNKSSCVETDCHNPIFNRKSNLCEKHYRQDKILQVNRKTKCIYEKVCHSKVIRRGMCSKHYNIYLKNKELYSTTTIILDIEKDKEEEFIGKTIELLK